jgi:aldose 1-epimerase
MKIGKKCFGVIYTGASVDLFTLKAGDLTLTATNYGGTLVSLLVPSRKGGREDILLGYSTLDAYMGNKPYLGVTVGRFANRIGSARFDLQGTTYGLYKNDGSNCLHGGRRGFDKQVWSAEAYEEKGGVYLRLELESPDGDEGFPGNLKAAVTYGITGDDELICDYRAKVDVPCPINLTNHAYFNLMGEGAGTILGHELKLHSSSYVVATSALLPTGVLDPVAGTPFDFKARKAIGRDIASVAGGYDHCFAVDGKADTLRPCAEVFEPLSGRTMKLATTQPGVQFYSGNFLNGVSGKRGSVYDKHYGFCLETQHYPDSPNQSAFPSCIFGPDRKYHEKSVFSFEC